MSLLNVFKRLFDPRQRPFRLETAILDSIGPELPEGDALLWNAQVAAINKVHRSPDGKEVNFWVIQAGRADFPREICFARTEEFKIAVVDLTADDIKLALRARVWCVGGHLFSIEYNRSLSEFERMADGGWKIHCHIESYPADHG